MDRRPAGKNGFSLLELLIVLFILVALSVWFNAEFVTTGRNKAALACQSNLQKIYLALSIYANDNHGEFPFIKGADSPSQPLSLLVPKSTTVTEMFICPGSSDEALPEAESFATRKISYAYYMGRATNGDSGALLASDAQIDSSSKSAGARIFSANGRKPGNNHGKKGGNLLSCGGEVTSTGPKLSRNADYPSGVQLLNPK